MQYSKKNSKKTANLEMLLSNIALQPSVQSAELFTQQIYDSGLGGNESEFIGKNRKYENMSIKNVPPFSKAVHL